ncbi:MAG: AAA family ATPase [Theionarchaea archaeon]|nr:AAA family ATPase [Theionarchaea archaeon]
MNILITGAPGVGKTTLIQTLISGCTTATGFYTREIREQNKRVGFAIETLCGKKGILAHIDIQSPYMVSRYGVNLSHIDTICVPSMDLSGYPIVIDEIGKMELFSSRFRTQVLRALDTHKVLATIMEHPHTFTDTVKSRTDTTIFRVTRQNRETVCDELKTSLFIERGGNVE